MFIPLPRLLGAAAVLLIYIACCLFQQQRTRQRALAREDGLPQPGQAALWVAYASQTGLAQWLAEETARILRRAGTRIHLLALGSLQASDLRALAATGTPLLVVASTCGEGDCPDDASDFVDRVMAPAADSLQGLRYGLLALGDRSYVNFCGFGRRLDDWLRSRRAEPLFPSIEVDKGDEDALLRWQHQTAALAAPLADRQTDTTATEEEPASWQAWRLLRRERLDDGNDDLPLVRLELVPADGELPTWQAGDLALVMPPAPEASLVQPRAYSIASLPEEGCLHLLVRLRRNEAGQPGLASGWLTHATPGTLIPLRLRSHPAFHLADNAARPLILIGAGTGIAGLRAHLLARIQRGEHRNWLIFGERRQEQDFHYGDDILSWRGSGQLARLDLAFSRDQAEKIYVQDRLAAAGDELRRWLADGAALYLCGSAATLAPAVDQVLTDLIGAPAVNALVAAGRYRRDVY